MRKATATYHAPEGDAKSTNIGGVVFNDGEAVEINSDEHPHLMEKLQGNQHFEFEAGEDDEKPRRGRPPNRDLKKGMEEARDHDFEADQRANAARKQAEAEKVAAEKPQT
jgi:hypothetical protein